MDIHPEQGSIPHCDMKDLKPGTRIICGRAWHGVVLFNNTHGWCGDESNRAMEHLGPGFMAHYVEAGLVFQEDADEIELDLQQVPDPPASSH